MPIYEQSYRKYEARGPLRTIRFWPITREALKLVLSKRAFLGLLALAWVPFVVRVGQLYIVTRFPEANRVLPVGAQLFGEFLNQQIGFMVILSVFGAAGLIANDLRTGGILVYLSRPLTRRDYVFGKIGVPMALNLFASLVPGILLYVVALALAPDQFVKWELAWISPAVVLYAVAASLSLSLLMLAISALSRSGRVAGLSFFALFTGLEIARGVLRNIFDARAATLLSLQADLRALGNALFAIKPRRWEAVHWGEAALVLTAVGVACVLILRSRVRAVEIVR